MKKWQLFLKVLHSYSLEEKVVSLVILGCVIFLSIQSIGSFSSSTAFASQDSYSEGMISNQRVLLNPLLVDETNRDLTALIFSGLTKYDPATKSFVSDLADHTLSVDHKVYRFTLKPNLVWHDGKPVTSDDVYFTFHDVIQNPDFPNVSLHLNFEGIQIKKIDERTVEFELGTPNSFFITNLNVGIVPQHLLSQVPMENLLNNAFNFKPVGTGPYQVDTPIETFSDGKQKVTLKSFANYSGGVPKIHTIRVNVYPDEKSLLQEKNALDVVAKAPQNFVDTGGNFQFSTYELPQYAAVFLNTARPIFKNDKIRLALLKSVDKTTLLSQLKDRIAVDTPLLELNQSDWIYKANVKEAQGALYDSGYKKYSDTPFRKDANGNVLRLTLLARSADKNSATFQEINTVTTFLKKSWENIGIQIDLQMVDPATFTDRVQKRDYDLLLTGQSLGYNLDTYSYWHSSQAEGKGLNFSNYHSFAADELIKDIRESFDPEIKNKKLKELAGVLAKDIPAIFLYRPQYHLANDGKVKNIELENLAYPSDRYANVVNWCTNCP